MPRIRSIYPEACRSRKLALLTPAAERCWWRLQTHLDDHGRAEDEPDIFASVLFQVQRDVTPGMVDRWLWEMAEAELIDRYEVGGLKFLAVRRWSDFQHPQRPKVSRFPAPDQGIQGRVREGYGTFQGRLSYGWERDGMGEGWETDTETEGESEGEVGAAPAVHRSVDSQMVVGLRERLTRIEACPPVRVGGPVESNGSESTAPGVNP